MTHSSVDSGILLVTCPDQRGLVAAIANYLFGLGANILHSDQHQDRELGVFLMRVEWELAGAKATFEEFKSGFGPIAAKFNMSWRMERSSAALPAMVFVSKMDHCLADLLYRHERGELGCQIRGVISNHLDAKKLVQFHGLNFHHVPISPTTKSVAEKKHQEILAKEGVRLIVLARYMQVLSREFLDEFGSPVINVHHSFLPAFSGAKPYHRAFERGVKLIGATSHYVNEDLDDGPIIEQDVARISHRDQLPQIIERGRELEKAVLARAVAWHAQHRILVYQRKTVIFD